MKLDRVGNAKRNIFYSLLNKIVMLLFPFVIRTVLIKEIGAEFLGLNSLFASILQVLNLAELGFTSAVVFSMYKPIAEDDTETLCAILRFLRSVYYKISIAILAAGLIILPFVPRLIKGSCPESINLYLVYLIYLLNTCLSYAFFSYKQTIFTAYQRIDILNNINTILYLFIYSLQLLIVYITHNVYLYLFSYTVSTLLMNFLSAIMAKKKFPHLVCKGNLSKEIKSDINQKVKGLIIGKIAGISRNAMDSVYMSAFLGLVETAIYNNYYYIMTCVTGFMVVIYSSIVAGVGNSVATETVEKNYEDLKTLNFIYMWISGWFSICLLCLYQPFTALFFGEDMLFPFTTVIAFCCYFYVLKIGDMQTLYREANGLYWKMRYIAITEAVFNIILNFVLGKYFGALGIVSATTISLLLITNTWGASVLFKNYFATQRLSEFLGRHLLYLLVTIGAGFVTTLICNFMPAYSVISLLERAAVCVMVPNILFFMVYFKTAQFKKSLQFLKNVMHWKRKVSR